MAIKAEVHMEESTVVGRLTRWAKWKFQNGVALGYPSQASFLRLVVDGTAIEHFIDQSLDSECVETDRAYRLLPELHQLVLRIEYLSTLSTVALKAYRFGTSKRTYEQYKNDAYRLLGNMIGSLNS